MKAEAAALHSWVVLTLVGTLVTGTLAPLLGAVLLAYLVKKWATTKLTADYRTAHLREMEVITRAILQQRVNAERARDYYAMAKAMTPRNASPQQIAVLENARRAAYAMANNPVVADQLTAHLQELKAQKGEDLLKSINLSGTLLACGTFICPIAALLIIAVEMLPPSRKNALRPQEFQWDWQAVTPNRRLLPG